MGLRSNGLSSHRMHLLAGTLAGLLVSICPALADAIDGQWCNPGGKHMKIDGPTIVTPGGSAIQGNYSRHSFTYVVPAKEPQAGQTVYMQLLGEEDLDVATGSPVAKPVRWKRCETIS